MQIRVKARVVGRDMEDFGMVLEFVVKYKREGEIFNTRLIEDLIPYALDEYNKRRFVNENDVIKYLKKHDVNAMKEKAKSMVKADIESKAKTQNATSEMIQLLKEFESIKFTFDSEE